MLKIFDDRERMFAAVVQGLFRGKILALWRMNFSSEVRRQLEWRLLLGELGHAGA